jgi:hypothetical protein
MSLGIVTITNYVENWGAYLPLRTNWKTHEIMLAACIRRRTMSLLVTTLGSKFCNHPPNDVLCFYAVPYHTFAREGNL